MKFKTKEGIAEGQSLSDIQEYNKQLALNTKAIRLMMWILFIVLLYLIYAAKKDHIFNAIIQRCFR